jgi:cytoskeleton protein RodZ
MSIGSDLKDARISRKITLETISNRTKIPVKYLEAIDENRFDVFPSQTYAKGFIRAYAKVVGLDPQLLTRQFNAEIQPEEMRIEPKNAEAELEKNLGWRPTLGRPAVFRRQEEEADLGLEMVEEEPIQHEPSIMRQKAFAYRRGQWAQWAGKGLLGLGALAAVFLLVLGVWKLVSRVKWSAPKTEAAATIPDGFQPVTVADKFQHLVLKGLDKSWVLVTLDDGQSSSEVDLDQGETKTYKAMKNFKVRLGNAGGVQIQFNGKPLGVLGAEGQVVEIQLPPGLGGSGTETSQDSDDNS